jgi:penicillin-binding protein 1A
MMGQVVTAGTARRADLGYTPVAGKTGTTQSYRDAWFVGFSAKYVTGVWFGNDDYSPTNRATGGSIPASTWKAFMLRADRAKAPVSLAGLPASQGHADFLAQNRNSLENVGGEEVQVAAVSTGDENADAGTDASTEDDAVVKVLRDMFTLFKTQQPAATRKVRVVRPGTNSNRVRDVGNGQRRNFNLNNARQRNAERLRRLLQTR